MIAIVGTLTLAAGAGGFLILGGNLLPEFIRNIPHRELIGLGLICLGMSPMFAGPDSVGRS